MPGTTVHRSCCAGCARLMSADQCQAAVCCHWHPDHCGPQDRAIICTCPCLQSQSVCAHARMLEMWPPFMLRCKPAAQSVAPARPQKDKAFLFPSAHSASPVGTDWRRRCAGGTENVAECFVGSPESALPADIGGMYTLVPANSAVRLTDGGQCVAHQRLQAARLASAGRAVRSLVQVCSSCSFDFGIHAPRRPVCSQFELKT